MAVSDEEDGARPIIFLDVDGVLNRTKFATHIRVDDDLVVRLRTLTRATGAQLVLSTFWREFESYIAYVLSRYDVRAPVIGRTPGKASSAVGPDEPTFASRSEEICAWLRCNGGASGRGRAVVVLDDRASAGLGPLAAHFVHVDRAHGLSDADVQRAIAILEGPPLVLDVSCDWGALPEPALAAMCLCLPARALCAAMRVNRHWSAVAGSDVAWTRACERAGIRPSGGRAAYTRRLERTRVDTSVCPHELQYACACGGGAGDSVVKRSSAPDISWCFSSGTFGEGEGDEHVTLTVEIVQMGDEMRIGFTTDAQQLLRRERFTVHEPSGYLYSDGSAIEGVWAGGAHVSRGLVPRYQAGDRVGVRLDFRARVARWFLNGLQVYEFGPLPDGPLRVCVALDDGGDHVHVRGEMDVGAGPPPVLDSWYDPELGSLEPIRYSQHRAAATNLASPLQSS